jgi:hypothetical protein
MSLPIVSGVSTSPPPQRAAEARVNGRWLPLARLGCLVVALASLIVWGWGVPLRYAQLATVCVSQTCGDQQMTPATFAQLRAGGVSLQFFATCIGTLEVAFVLVYLVVAALIFWRRSDTRVGLLTVVFLATYAATQTSADALATAVPTFEAPVNLLSVLSFVSLGLFLYLFPDGRFVPRWTRWAILAWILLFVIGQFALGSSAFVGVLFAIILASLVAQIYRYRRVSASIQRQQTKWVVFGVVISLIGSIGIITLSNLLTLAGATGAQGLLAGDTAIYLFGALIPLSIGVAILRSRLWDIDVIINRALVYGVLTALLAAIYAGLIIGLEHLLGAFEHGRITEQPITIVISTLAIAALFQPLRTRIQALIDQRLYRTRYDAARTLAAFGATLRQDVDLHILTGHLIDAIDDTMKPSHVSLWLQPRDNRATPASTPAPTGDAMPPR